MRGSRAKSFSLCMKTFALVLAGVLCAACAPAPSQPVTEVPTQTSVAGAPDLTGHYRIDRLADGTALDWPIEVSFDEDSVWWEPGCAGQGLAYRASENGVEFYSARPEGIYAVCDIGFPEQLPQLWEELSGAKQVRLGPDRVVRLSNGNEEWVFQPTTDPLPTDLAGKWRLMEMNGWGSSEMRTIEFEADGSQIWWNPRCAGQAVAYEMDGERFAVEKPRVSDTAPSEEARVVCRVGIPEALPEALNAMRTATRVARDKDNNIVISGDGSYVVLQPIA